jgi:hypothetical protein
MKHTLPDGLWAKGRYRSATIDLAESLGDSTTSGRARGSGYLTGTITDSGSSPRWDALFGIAIVWGNESRGGSRVDFSPCTASLASSLLRTKT